MTSLSGIAIDIQTPFEAQVDPGRLERAVRVALDVAGVRETVELSVLITDNQTVRELNRDYRDLDEETDVLSFALEAGDVETGFVLPPDLSRQLGEVIIAYPKTATQAAEQGRPVEQELDLLTIHGVLHLLGHDHLKLEDEQAMQARERTAMEQLGWAGR